MSTPQEKRYAALAVARRGLTHEQINEAARYQSRSRAAGRELPLWQCAVLCKMLGQSDSERLWEEAGDLPLGRIEQYQIVKKLGQGGMGSVWLGIGDDHEKVAIKVASGQLARDQTLITRFLREAEACTELKHRNIVGGLGGGEQEGFYYFIMEYVRGLSVEQMLEASGALRDSEATLIIRQAAEGLQYAHDRGFIHRDIKPANIMVTTDHTARIMDFGLAHNVDPELTALTQSGATMGTPLYMAPEQIGDARNADARSDIYALGATWYHMLTGRPPFEAGSTAELLDKHRREPLIPVRSRRPSVPVAVSQVIDRMMAKSPDLRIQSASELCSIIDARCAGRRDIVDELGLGDRSSGEPAWEMKVEVRGKLEKRRLNLDEVRERYKRGQVTRETPTRRVGVHGKYEPAREFLELDREVFRDYAVTAHGPQHASSTHKQLHELVTHYDEQEKRFRRRKWLRRLKRWALHAVILLVLAVLALLLWPEIRSLVAAPEASESSSPPADAHRINPTDRAQHPRGS